jgi:hypothetical protein
MTDNKGKGQTMSKIDPEKLWTEAKDLGDELVDAGADPDKTAHAIAGFVDALIPLDLIPGIGVVLEAADGPAIERLIRALVELFKADPQKKAERKARRKARRSGRR